MRRIRNQQNPKVGENNINRYSTPLASLIYVQFDLQIAAACHSAALRLPHSADELKTNKHQTKATQLSSKLRTSS